VSGLLSLELAEGVALVTLQRPEKRNALSIDLRLELADAFGRPPDGNF
jgi:enoyl-CoA hydratase/carnithine racemase